MANLLEWRTGISLVERGRISLRGKDLTELIASSSFGHVVLLLFTGTEPPAEHGRMMDGILVALCEHSVHAPSTMATRIAASAGNPLQASVAAGVSAVGDHHGGALEGAMVLLHDLGSNGAATREDVARRVRDSVDGGKRLPGFGHPYHRPDPRGVALRALAESLSISAAGCRTLDLVTEELTAYAGRDLMPNADGAAAAILVDMGLDPAYGRGVFIVARTVGLVAHAVEEQQRERPVRMIEPELVVYDGPPPPSSAGPAD
jgi:citryl-CoA lyase